jgi:hypothetical protein
MGLLDHHNAFHGSFSERRAESKAHPDGLGSCCCPLPHASALGNGHSVGMRRLLGLGVAATVLAASACSASGGDHCDASGSARLCVTKKSGGYEIKARGLRPGSKITSSMNGKPFGSGTTVGADGGLGGVIGLLGPGVSDGNVVVAGTARSGHQLRVALHAG